MSQSVSHTPNDYFSDRSRISAGPPGEDVESLVPRCVLWKSFQSCPAPCDPMGHSRSGSSVLRAEQQNWPHFHLFELKQLVHQPEKRRGGWEGPSPLLTHPTSQPWAFPVSQSILILTLIGEPRCSAAERRPDTRWLAPPAAVVKYRTSHVGATSPGFMTSAQSPANWIIRELPGLLQRTHRENPTHLPSLPSLDEEK